MGASISLRVKERDEVDRCRFCGRPTWSFGRCCVRCKRAGRTGLGAIPSLYAERSTACRVFAFACFWTAHVVAAVLIAVVLMLGMGRPFHSGALRGLLALGLLESTLDGIGFVIAMLLSPRPVAAARPRFYLLAACTGVFCTMLTSAAVVAIGRAGTAPVLFGIPVVLAAAASRVCLATSFTTRLLESGTQPEPCAICGAEPSDAGDLFCRECGERRTTI